MRVNWFIGTTTRDPLDEEGGGRRFSVNLAVPVTQDEHEELRTAANQIRKAMRGALFRLVFANHQELHAHFKRMSVLLRSGQRDVNWGEQHLQTQLLFANWLGSVRWLLDHTRSRLHDDLDRLGQFVRATNEEFDGYFAYRFTYKLRDYSTHCDLPPLTLDVQSREQSSGQRTDAISVHMKPKNLLGTWDGWGRHVTRDLRERTEPIELLPLVNDAMGCIERLMVVILATDALDLRSSAQLIVGAIDRLPSDSLGGSSVPMLFQADMDGESIRFMSPTPLPIAQALQILAPLRSDLP